MPAQMAHQVASIVAGCKRGDCLCE